jgi:hypothetical protein
LLCWMAAPTTQPEFNTRGAIIEIIAPSVKADLPVSSIEGLKGKCCILDLVNYKDAN